MRVGIGRVAVITGAAGGIGSQLALALARRGCDIAAVDIDAAGLARTVRMVRALDRRASALHVDVADADAMLQLPARVRREFGSCHILINNAGVTSAGGFESETLEDIHWIVNTNVWGVIHGCYAFLPMLREQDEAHIVNVSSMVGLVGLPHNAVYALTKGAVRSFSEALRAELVSSGIGLTTVFPGAYRTRITEGARGNLRDLLARLGRSPLAGIVMRSPATVARRIVRAIESDRARVVSGLDARILDMWSRVAPGRIGPLGRFTGRIERWQQARRGRRIER